MQQKNLIIILVVVIVIALSALGVYIFFPDVFKSLTRPATEIKKEQPKVIEEILVIPETEKITGTEGRFGGEGNVQTPLMPKDESEKVIVTKAILTLKGSYDLAAPEAKKWSQDAVPALVKSLGAITLEGKSSQWQVVFSSAIKKNKGYEIIVQANQIVSMKEIDSTAVGADFPANLKDSAEAIRVLQELPQYSDATLSNISLYYNTDGKIWRYTLSTSKGSISTSAQ